MAAALLLPAVAFLSPSTAGATSAKAAIHYLNQQRRANGIPGKITLRSKLNRGCQRHNRWMARHNVMMHGEIKGMAGYSRIGDLAGQHSVLASGANSWTSARRNPWESAPLHMSDLLEPTLKVSGYSEAHGYSCAQVLAVPRNRSPKKPRLFTYPGPGTTIYRGERAAEIPFTPGQLVGIPQYKPTGPYIYLLISARHYLEKKYVLREPAKILKASLRQIGGRKVRLARLDTRNLRLRGYIAPGGYLIPRHPLKAKARYEAKVTILFRGKKLKRTWRFRTSSRIIGWTGSG